MAEQTRECRLDTVIGIDGDITDGWLGADGAIGAVPIPAPMGGDTAAIGISGAQYGAGAIVPIYDRGIGGMGEIDFRP